MPIPLEWPGGGKEPLFKNTDLHLKDSRSLWFLLVDKCEHLKKILSSRLILMTEFCPSKMYMLKP